MSRRTCVARSGAGIVDRIAEIELVYCIVCYLVVELIYRSSHEVIDNNVSDSVWPATHISRSYCVLDQVLPSSKFALLSMIQHLASHLAELASIGLPYPGFAMAIDYARSPIPSHTTIGS